MQTAEDAISFCSGIPKLMVPHFTTMESGRSTACSRSITITGNQQMLINWMCGLHSLLFPSRLLVVSGGVELTTLTKFVAPTQADGGKTHQLGKYSVFQNKLYNIFQMLFWGESSTPSMLDGLYAFKCKRFCNTRHTVTFEIPSDGGSISVYATSLS
jgi:hypothetical protein